MRAILTWHSIDSSNSPISVSREEFGRQLAWLEQAGVRVVPLEELLTLPDSVDAAALTFDDGLANAGSEALPALEARGWNATLFVVTSCVGLDNRWPASRDKVPTFPTLGWGALGRIQQRGFRIGAHTRRHPQLPRCNSAVLQEELLGAADEIEQRLGRRPEAFAYPYGEFDARCVALVAASYRWGCTTQIRPLAGEESMARLPRIDARYLRGIALRQGWSSNAFRRFLGLRRALRAIRQAVA
jgi:peptidoglycan/xylan/chitin deacetylase (PgdA/CDA1 family)